MLASGECRTSIQTHSQLNKLEGMRNPGHFYVKTVVDHVGLCVKRAFIQLVDPQTNQSLNEIHQQHIRQVLGDNQSRPCFFTTTQILARSITFNDEVVSDILCYDPMLRSSGGLMNAYVHYCRVMEHCPMLIEAIQANLYVHISV